MPHSNSSLQFGLILLLSAIPLISVGQGGGKAEPFPSFALYKAFVVKSSSAAPPSGTLYTTASEVKWNPRSRRRDGSSGGDTFYPADLVFVPPGALEPEGQGGGYYLSLDEQLGLRYDTGTFSFSGRADSLLWLPRAGWMSEEMDRSFYPLLIRRDYENVQEPSYEFIWQHTTDIPVKGDSIYLNYVFKVPVESRILETSELRVGAQSFARGFSSDVPPVSGGKICLWQSGSLYTYDAKLAWKESLSDWNSLPSDLQATSFCMSGDGTLAIFSTADGFIRAFTKDGSEKWKVPGSAPATTAGAFAYSPTMDYSSLQAIRLSDGSASSMAPLPRYLPMSPNSLVSAKLSGKDCLFLLVPSQSTALCFISLK